MPDGLDDYAAWASVTTDPNPVAVTASFDPGTGLLTWTMSSIDPVTGQLVEDPLAGFLPPNTTNGIGEGYVTYTVRPKNSLANGTVITNQANIVFDVNAPILTPVVTNTIDSVSPHSTMQPLPATETNAQFTVQWSGSDATGSGVASIRHLCMHQRRTLEGMACCHHKHLRSLHRPNLYQLCLL